jgi:hypothetical protein
MIDMNYDIWSLIKKSCPLGLYVNCKTMYGVSTNSVRVIPTLFFALNDYSIVKCDFGHHIRRW